MKSILQKKACMIPSLENNAMYDKTFSEDLEVYKKTMGVIEKEFKEEKDALANYLENSLLNNNEENGYKFKGVWSINYTALKFHVLFPH